ncbi:MAG TPA: hypothetical protein VFC79_12760 [Tissierellaceae bacterium]|nr:hypothetical protein [Tissierellaceae bacterium]
MIYKKLYPQDLGKQRVLKNVAVSETIDSILGTPISKLKLVQEVVTDVTITNSIDTLKGEDKNESK